MNEQKTYEICTSGVHLRMCAGPNASECTECESCIKCTKRIKKECYETHVKRHEAEKSPSP